MTFDRQITISIANSRQSTNWKPWATTVAELYDRIKTPVRSTETLAEYMALKKAQQDEKKDVGGFVGGPLSGPRRKTANVLGRDLVTLDFDNIPGWGADGIYQRLDALGYSYAVYSTRKHAANKPRLRVLLPLDRTATPEEYEPVARRLAQQIGIGMADPTTFEVARLMYWPSCCADSEYIYRAKDAPLTPVDAILGTYADWRNIGEWPQVPGEFNYQRLAVRQGDPLTKKGIVGAFCRAYDIFAAMDKFLPGIYAPVDTGDENRFTFTGGSTSGGAVVYDNGKFLFSHHATDPCSGRLVNAFDMVRLHKFGHLDADSDETTVNRLPSYAEMGKLVREDRPAMLELIAAQQAEAVSDFAGVAASASPTSPAPGAADAAPGSMIVDTAVTTEAEAPADPPEWLVTLERDENGRPKNTINNVITILENDPNLRGCFKLNQFSGRGEVLGALPWDKNPKRRAWQDADNDGLYWYLESVPAYKITKRSAIDSALSVHAAAHAFNEVQDYLNGLTWDGVRRLDTLFIDYLGAEDTPYTRAVTRKAFTAAVARAMEPGCKYDTMLILCGPQGIGKSTILDRMSRGWFNDSIRTFEGKDASELLQGVWLVEVAELDAFRRTDVARIKQFLSLRVDRYRAAYGRNVKELPRCCVFFGTCNQVDFLQDTTGNRRFWPVDVGIQPLKARAWELDAQTIDQLWAEARVRWQCGEPLFLTGEVDDAARVKQEEHREELPREGMIREFVERRVPADWKDWPIDRRRDFWAGAVQGADIELMPRERICKYDVWCELFNGNPRDIKNTDTREINAVIGRIPGWKKTGNLDFKPYGKGRGFQKIGS